MREGGRGLKSMLMLGRVRKWMERAPSIRLSVRSSICPPGASCVPGPRLGSYWPHWAAWWALLSPFYQQDNRGSEV